MSTVTVTPIIIGFPFSQGIAFVDGSGDPLAGFDLTTASRIFGEARSAPGAGNEVLAQFDSAATPPTLVANNANTLTFSMPIATTYGLAPYQTIWIDFAREDSGVWSLLPAQLQWPILIPVTAPPPP